MTQLINALGVWNTSATRHSPIEDVQGIFSGSLVAALGLYVLASAGLLTGSTAGVAFLLHYAFGVNFGLAFDPFALRNDGMKYLRVEIDRFAAELGLGDRRRERRGPAGRLPPWSARSAATSRAAMSSGTGAPTPS